LSALLFVTVLGTIALALAIDLVVLIGWAWERQRAEPHD
jgi:hypothetical protein